MNFINNESISVLDNKIFNISVKGILANELLNPFVNNHLEYYPHDPCGDPIDSLCQSFKWREDLPREVRVQIVPNESGKGFDLIMPAEISFANIANQQAVDIMEFQEMYSEILMENQVYMHEECGGIIYGKYIDPYLRH
ncbi:hypothetical protein PTTG_07878 [Puccinia triticina 1-1 BBBD Race 1]|uniref:Uncharacterized protein n=1 Tax=Puccinia triticina (isolate 1-1 / race 1 (BBBD)) TaxID=630390 RepID=A0A180GJH6_PUCT1|nr:hypothetical protein PTTG_07878 [Puccinia triticina 1-1 BBBD Race 1]